MSDVIKQIVEIQERSEVCPVCGETSPGARWICLTRFSQPAAKVAADERKCSYSVEGNERLTARLSSAFAGEGIIPA